jgi:hypothetical protein
VCPVFPTDDSWPAARGDDADSCVVAACVAGAWGVRSIDVRGLNPAVIIIGFFYMQSSLVLVLRLAIGVVRPVLF